MPASQHPLLYRTVAGYCLIEYVGAGGMGEVFKAEHTSLNRTAAVKVLYRPEFAARFRNEAHLQASLSHPNIATLYEYDLLDNRPALVMEWIDGISLDELIRQRKRLSNDETLRISRQLVEAVAHLHQKGIIHRDLKPSNIRVRPDGQVKLLDFGIAKGRFTPQLTQAGYVVGTTEFMAPEQFRGQVDFKSDLWALGVLLYEMVTGHLPFEANNPLMLRSVIERGQFTSPKLLNPNVSTTFVIAITECLQLNPTKRFSAAQLTQHLKDQHITKQNLPFSDEIQQLYTTINATTTSRHWILALLIGILFFGVFYVLPKPSKPNVLSEIQVQNTASDSSAIFEQILVEVLNADDDLQLIMSDGSTQSQEPFLVKRIPGQPLSITIRHRGHEQQFVIDPDVHHLYQCFFDR